MSMLGSFTPQPEPFFKELTPSFLITLAPIVREISPMGLMLDKCVSQNKIDFEAGLRQNDHRNWSFWLVMGQRIDIAEGLDGGWLFDMTTMSDPERPNT